MVTKYICEKHPESNYVEIQILGSENVLVCQTCAQEESYRSNIQAIKDSGVVEVEELTLVGSVMGENNKSTGIKIYRETK